MFKLLDGRKEFWQWDLNCKLIVEDASITTVHFCNRTDNCSLTRQTYNINGITLVDVPNVILQSDLRFRVYAYCGYTKYEETFKVNRRTKPEDYVFTDTEVRTYDELVERVNQIEENGVSDERIGEAVSEYLDENPVSVDLSDYATKDYVDDAIGNIEIPEGSVNVDLSNYATKKYVDDAIGNIEIPEGSVNVDLSVYATKEYVAGVVEGMGAGAVINQNGGGVLKIWAGSQAEYNAILVKDEDTVYLIDGATTSGGTGGDNSDTGGDDGGNGGDTGGDDSDIKDSVVFGYYYDNSGELVSEPMSQADSSKCGDVSSLLYREVEPSTQITFSCSKSIKATIIEYTADKNFIQRQKGTTAATSHTFTTTTNTKFIRIGIAVTVQNTDTVREAYEGTVLTGCDPVECRTDVYSFSV